MYVMKELVEVRNENEKLKVKVIKNEDAKREEMGVYNENENV